jgi:hypothetical protein
MTDFITADTYPMPPQWEVIHDSNDAEGLAISRFTDRKEAEAFATSCTGIIEWATPNKAITAELWHWNGKPFHFGLRRKMVKKYYA